MYSCGHFPIICIVASILTWLHLLVFLSFVLFIKFQSSGTPKYVYLQMLLVCSSLWITVMPPQRKSMWTLMKLKKLSDEWLVTFSAPKTKSMIISNKMDRNNHPRVSMHNSVLEDISHHKHLGLVLSNNLCWTNDIDEVYVKAMQRLDIIQSFKFKLDRTSLERCYLGAISMVL